MLLIAINLTDNQIKNLISFMAIAFDKLHQILQNAFPDSTIELVDLVGDQDHYSVKIIDKIFINKSRVQQHKMVNLALKDILGEELHALQIKTSTPN